MTVAAEQEVLPFYPNHALRDTPVGIKDVVHYGLATYGEDQTQGERLFDRKAHAFVTATTMQMGERALEGFAREPIHLLALDLYKQQYPGAVTENGAISEAAFNGISCAVFAYLEGETPNPDMKWSGL